MTNAHSISLCIWWGIINTNTTHRFQHGRVGVERHAFVLLVLLGVCHSRAERARHEAELGQAVDNGCVADVKLIHNAFITQELELLCTGEQQ